MWSKSLNGCQPDKHGIIHALLWFEVVYVFDGDKLTSVAVTSNTERQEMLVDLITSYLQDAIMGPRDPQVPVKREPPVDGVHRIKIGWQSRTAGPYAFDMPRDQEAHNDVGDVWGLEDNCEDRAMRVGILQDALRRILDGSVQVKMA